MLQKAVEQKIFVSRTKQIISGNDTDFIVNLGQTFTNVKRMALNMICLDNFFLNLNNLTIETGGITYVLKPDVYINYFNYLSWINEQLAEQGANLILSQMPDIPSWRYTYLDIQGKDIDNNDVSFSFPDLTSDWYKKLGFEAGINDISNNIQHSASPADFNQTSCILIYITNLNYGITNSVNATFMVDNISSFNTKLIRYFFNYNTTQSVVFSQDQPFTQFRIQLLDEDGNLLRTPNNNDTHISVVMSISAYDE